MENVCNNQSVIPQDLENYMREGFAGAEYFLKPYYPSRIIGLNKITAYRKLTSKNKPKFGGRIYVR